MGAWAPDELVDLGLVGLVGVEHLEEVQDLVGVFMRCLMHGSNSVFAFLLADSGGELVFVEEKKIAVRALSV